MNRWKISTFILALVSVGLLALNLTGGEALQGKLVTGITPDLTEDSEDRIVEAITDVHEEVGYSSWTLQDLAVEIASVHNQLGYSTWSLPALAENTMSLVAYHRGILEEFIEEEIDNSSWTLSSLATYIGNTCR